VKRLGLDNEAIGEIVAVVDVLISYCTEPFPWNVVVL